MSPERFEAVGFSSVITEETTGLVVKRSSDGGESVVQHSVFVVVFRANLWASIIAAGAILSAVLVYLGRAVGERYHAEVGT